MKKRKYIAEFGLNVSTGYKTIIPVEYLDQVNDGHDYHIYFIMSCPKVLFDKDTLKNNEKGIHLTLNRLINGGCEKINITNFLIERELDHTKIELITKYPYSCMDIIIKDEKFLLKETGNIEPLTIEIEAQGILNHIKNKPKLEFEVLYIGQSYGKAGERNVLTRLKSNSTLQKVFTDYYSKSPDKRIHIFLLEINPMLQSSFDGRTKCFIASDIEEKEHFENIFTNPLKYEQIINITEAALINYFKPTYNVNFVDNFPDITHKGYKQYYDLDYNSLIIELDLYFKQPFQSVQLYTDYNRINSSSEFIKYKLFNDENRKCMTDIFK